MSVRNSPIQYKTLKFIREMYFKDRADVVHGISYRYIQLLVHLCDVYFNIINRYVLTKYYTNRLFLKRSIFLFIYLIFVIWPTYTINLSLPSVRLIIIFGTSIGARETTSKHFRVQKHHNTSSLRV